MKLNRKNKTISDLDVFIKTIYNERLEIEITDKTNGDIYEGILYLREED